MALDRIFVDLHHLVDVIADLRWFWTGLYSEIAAPLSYEPGARLSSLFVIISILIYKLRFEMVSGGMVIGNCSPAMSMRILCVFLIGGRLSN